MKIQIAVCIHTHRHTDHGCPCMVSALADAVEALYSKKAQIGKSQRVAWDVRGSEDRRVPKESPRGWSVNGQKEVTWEAPKGCSSGGEADRS